MCDALRDRGASRDGACANRLAGADGLAGCILYPVLCTLMNSMTVKSGLCSSRLTYPLRYYVPEYCAGAIGHYSMCYYIN